MQWQEDQLKPEKDRILLHADVSTDEPLIVMATANMLRWAKEHGHRRPVSMDTTFGITRYGYSICTLTAVGGRGKGVPICVAIMKRERAEDFAEVLRILRDKVGADWRPSIFLTDCAEAEHNAIRCVPLLMSVRGLCQVCLAR